MGRVLSSLPERSVELAQEWAEARRGLLDLFNREIMPMLRLLRRAVNGPLAATDVKTSDYTLTLSDELVIMNDELSAGIGATLPTEAPIGHCAHVANVGPIAVDVNAPSGEVVEGTPTILLPSGVTSKYIKVTSASWHRLQ